MKVGIIGAGIAGLTCAWRLSQAGITTVLFEKEPTVGGRAVYSGAVSPGLFDKRLNRLIEEFGLQELAIPLKAKKEVGFLTEEGKLLNLEEFQDQMKKKFAFFEGLKLWQTFHSINSLNLDVANPDPKIYELRKISFEDFIKKHSPKIGQALRDTVCFFGETKNFNSKKMSAEYGLTIVRLASEFQSGRAFTFEENNALALANVLAQKLRQKENQILTATQVTRVEKEKDEFKVCYKRKGKTEETKVDRVVISTTLDVIPKIFPQLDLKTDVYYYPAKTIFVKGEFNYPEIKVLKGNPGNPANLAIMYNTVPTYQTIHCTIDKKINLDPLYKTKEIFEEKTIKALPVIGPRAKVPELKTKIEGAYLAGDFYYHPFLETAVTTAEMVAGMIKKQK